MFIHPQWPLFLIERAVQFGTIALRVCIDAYHWWWIVIRQGIERAGVCLRELLQFFHAHALDFRVVGLGVLTFFISCVVCELAVLAACFICDCAVRRLLDPEDLE